MQVLKDLFLRRPAAYAAAGSAAFAALAALYATVATNAPSLDPRWAVYLDVTNFYWIQTWADPSLFPKDPQAAWYLAKMHTFCTEMPWVWFTSLFMRAVPYTLGLRWLTVLACAAATLLVFRLAARSSDRPAAAAALFAVCFLSMDSFYGVPRVYGALVFLGFVLAAEERRFLLLPFLVAAALVLYPIAALGVACSALLAPLFYREEFAERRLLPRYAAAMAFSALLCLVGVWGSAAGEGIGRALGAGNGFEAYKLYQFVARPLDTANPLHALAYFALNFNEYGRLFPVMSALLLLPAAAGFAARPGRPALPRAVLMALAGSLAAFAALYAVHPVTASRQMVFAVPLAAVFLAADGLRRLFGDRLRSPAAAAAAFLAFALLYPFLGQRESAADFSQAYEYLAALPKDAVAAGHPSSRLLMGVPVFARRQAFVIDEHRDQYLMYITGAGDFDRRRAALVSALYADGPERACALGPAYGVTHVVMEEDFYRKDYLARAAASAFPREAEVARAAAAAKDPLGFYKYARRHAALAWRRPRSEGVIFDLAACTAPEGK